MRNFKFFKNITASILKYLNFPGHDFMRLHLNSNRSIVLVFQLEFWWWYFRTLIFANIWICCAHGHSNEQMKRYECHTFTFSKLFYVSSLSSSLEKVDCHPCDNNWNGASRNSCEISSLESSYEYTLFAMGMSKLWVSTSFLYVFF